MVEQSSPDPKNYKSGDYMFKLFRRPPISYVLDVIKLHLGISVGDTVRTYEHSWKKRGGRVVNPYNPDHITNVKFEEDKLICYGWTGSPEYKRKATLKYNDITQCVLDINTGTLKFTSSSGCRNLYYWNLTFKQDRNSKVQYEFMW